MTSYLPLVQSVPISASVFENVYQETSNTRKSRTPVVNSQVVKDVFNSSNIQGGGYTSIDLVQGPLLSHAMVCLKFSMAEMNALVTAGKRVYLRPGWGYRCINNYQILTGGNTQLRVYGRQLQTKVWEDCETKEKRDAVMTLGGPEYNGSLLTEDLVAYVHIYLPWSNISASKYLPYDSGILTKPIRLQFEFASNLQIFSFAQADYAAIYPLLPTAFLENYFMTQTALMALGPGESIRPAVGPNGQSQYNYGWIYPSPFTSEQFTGVPASSGALQSVRLQDFQNGNVQSITLYLERLTLGATGADIPISQCPNSEIVYEDITNVTITYGGQVVYRADDATNKLMALSEYTSTNDINVDFPNMSNLAITGPITVNSRTASWVLINFAQFREQYFKNLVQDCVSPVNNMMLVQFNTPELTELSNGAAGGNPTPIPATGIPVQQPTYVLHANYNMLGSLNTYKGYTDFQWLPANAQGPYTMAS